jgi:hypothetical protein
MLKNLKPTEDVGIDFDILLFEGKDNSWKLNNESYVVPAELKKVMQFVVSTNSRSLRLKFDEMEMTIRDSDVNFEGKVVGRGILHSTNWKSIRERVKKNVELNFIFG